MRVGRRRWPAVLLCGIAAITLGASGAAAASPESALSDAEARASAAAGEIAGLEAQAEPAQAALAAAKRRAAPVAARAHAARRDVAEIRADLRRSHREAVELVHAAERERDDAAAKHAQRVSSELGFAVAALIAALIAVGWGWFRASAAVAALVHVGLGRAIGLCVGGGILVLLIGGSLIDLGGLLGVLGGLLVGLGLMLPSAFLLARHSAEVQRGRSRALLGHERLPALVTRGAGGALGVLFVILLAAAAFAGEEDVAPAPADAQEEAAHPTASSPALEAALHSEARLVAKAAELESLVDRKRAAAAKTEGQVEEAETRLADAEGDARRARRKLVAIERREAHALEVEEREAAKLVAREEREATAQARAAEEEAAEECNPNYSGCLDPSASDYDCEGGSGDGPLYTGTVEVLGYDEYDLDRDGDGIGCDD